MPSFRALMVLVVATSSVASAKTVIYMNRAGGMYEPAKSDDARINRSSLITRTAVVPPFSGSESDWSAILDCMRTLYAPFDVDITDRDPGDAPHLECVTGGWPEDAGFPANYGGVGTLAACGSTVPNAVVFAFADAWNGDPQLICEAAAQELGHTFALDHVLSCPDPMSYQYGCGAKVWQDEEARCGEYQSRLCRCGGATQNGFATLREILGERKAPRPATIVGRPSQAVFASEGKADRAGMSGESGCAVASGARAPAVPIIWVFLVGMTIRRAYRPLRAPCSRKR
jgi:hypothetical protein